MQHVGEDFFSLVADSNNRKGSEILKRQILHNLTECVLNRNPDHNWRTVLAITKMRCLLINDSYQNGAVGLIWGLGSKHWCSQSGNKVAPVSCFSYFLHPTLRETKFLKFPVDM